MKLRAQSKIRPTLVRAVQVLVHAECTLGIGQQMDRWSVGWRKLERRAGANEGMAVNITQYCQGRTGAC